MSHHYNIRYAAPLQPRYCCGHVIQSGQRPAGLQICLDCAQQMLRAGEKFLLTQRHNAHHAAPHQARYICGHVVQTGVQPVDPQPCRECAWMMLYGAQNFMRKQNESEIGKLKEKYQMTRIEFDRAVAQGDRKLAEALAGKANTYKADIKQIYDAGTSFAQRWSDLWTKKFGQPSSEELENRARWIKRDADEKEKREEYKRRMRAGQRPI
ncbi:MAG: hypothetical protein M1816_003485 [Peltula sp. TS41687]|nr:MAG: hypothetical protein M1816_003485 [Peltula sp. TS41687]